MVDINRSWKRLSDCLVVCGPFLISRMGGSRGDWAIGWDHDENEDDFAYVESLAAARRYLIDNWRLLDKQEQV